MRGEKTINFDYELLYSKAGAFVPATSITVRAPGLDQYKIHSRMQAWVAEAANGLRKAFSQVAAPAGAGDDEKDKPEEVDVDDARLASVASANLAPKTPQFSVRGLDGDGRSRAACPAGGAESLTSGLAIPTPRTKKTQRGCRWA